MPTWRMIFQVDIEAEDDIKASAQLDEINHKLEVLAKAFAYKQASQSTRPLAGVKIMPVGPQRTDRVEWEPGMVEVQCSRCSALWPEDYIVSTRGSKWNTSMCHDCYEEGYR